MVLYDFGRGIQATPDDLNEKSLVQTVRPHASLKPWGINTNGQAYPHGSMLRVGFGCRYVGRRYLLPHDVLVFSCVSV